MDDEDTRRRVRAARILGGFESREDLATRLKELGYPKLGKDTLYNIESGRRAILRPDLNAIADACNLAPAFFTTDLATLGAEQNGQADLEQRLRKIERVTEMVERDLAPLAGLDAAQLERLVAAAARTQPASRKRTTTRKRPTG